MADGAAELISAYNDVFVSNCMGYATLALLGFEYVITIRSEVDLFWRRRLTTASALFLINRYVVLLYNLSLLFQYMTFTQLSCSQWVNGTRVIEILIYLPWAVFSALRVFALSARNYTLATLVFLLSVVPIGINFADYHWYEGVLIDPFWGCVQNITEPADISIRLTIASRSALILADIIVIAVTWFATYNTTQLARHVGGHAETPPLSVLLLRDGMVYFIVLLAMNTLHLAFSTSSTLSDFQSISSIILLVEPMNAVLFGRFLLNLQDANLRSLQAGSTTNLGAPGRTTRTLRFERFVGSLGDSLVLSGSFSSADTNTDTDDDTRGYSSVEDVPGDARKADLEGFELRQRAVGLASVP